MVEERVEAIFEEHGIDKGNMEAAVELGRLVASETGLCCEDLGKFIMLVYRQLEGGE